MTAMIDRKEEERKGESEEGRKRTKKGGEERRDGIGKEG